VNAELVQALSSRQIEIRDRWETFLRLEPVASPLAHPDTLVFGIDGALREIFALLWKPKVEAGKGAVACACGRNPLEAFFVAGEQALLEVLVLVQTGQPRMAAADRSKAVDDLRCAVRHVAHRETSLIAGLCQACRTDD